MNKAVSTTESTEITKGDIVLTKEQAALVDGIKAHHAGFKQAFEHQTQYAFLIGMKLEALKKTCKHGEFEELAAAVLPEVSRTVKHEFRNFFRLATTKCPALGHLRPEALTLTNGDLPEDQKQEVLKAVYEAAEGKTWTAFYRALGFIRALEEKKHHPVKITSEEKLEAEVKASRAFADDLLLSIRMFIGDAGDEEHKFEHLRHCPPALREELLGEGIRLNDTLRELKCRKLKGQK